MVFGVRVRVRVRIIINHANLDPDREIIHFLKLTSDNDERTERTGKIKLAPHLSQEKKERRTDRNVCMYMHTYCRR